MPACVMYITFLTAILTALQTTAKLKSDQNEEIEKIFQRYETGTKKNISTLKSKFLGYVDEINRRVCSSTDAFQLIDFHEKGMNENLASLKDDLTKFLEKINKAECQDINQIFKSYENRTKQDFVSLKTRLLNYLDNMEKNDCFYSACSGIYKSGVRTDGVYKIDPDGLGSFAVWCDMQNGAAWTVFQRRLDSSVDFYRGWQDYKNGFGNLTGNFWLGLEKIHRLTKSGQNVLRVDLTDFENDSAYSQYKYFYIASESEDYKLTVGRFSGTAGDSLSHQNKMRFTTKDRDNDLAIKNCAVHNKGAWWYKHCSPSNLNGEYLNSDDRSVTGIDWYNWKYDRRSMKKTEMKLRS